MNNFGGLLQILVFVLVIAGPVIGGIAKKAKAHAEQKRREADRERRKMQALRTGQPIVEAERDERQSAEAVRRAKLEELQRRRQAQIEELRRRHREAQAAQQARASASQTRAPMKGGQPGRPMRSIPSPGRQGTAAADAAREAALERRRAEIRARREQYERAKAQAQASSRAVQKTKPPAATRPKPHPAVPVPARAHSGTPIEAASLSTAVRNPASIRRAIVMNEILSPPIALREPPGMAD